MKETCLNYTTGVTKALTKDHGQQCSAPHTARVHIFSKTTEKVYDYRENLKLLKKSESTAFFMARHTSHHSEP